MGWRPCPPAHRALRQPLPSQTSLRQTKLVARFMTMLMHIPYCCMAFPRVFVRMCYLHEEKFWELLHALLYLCVAFIHSACLLFMASKEFIDKYSYESLLPHVKSPRSFAHIRYLSSFFTMSIILVRPCAFKSLPGNVNMSQLLTSYCFGLSLLLLSLRIVNFQCRLSLAPSVPHM